MSVVEPPEQAPEAGVSTARIALAVVLHYCQTTVLPVERRRCSRSLGGYLFLILHHARTKTKTSPLLYFAMCFTDSLLPMSRDLSKQVSKRQRPVRMKNRPLPQEVTKPLDVPFLFPACLSQVHMGSFFSPSRCRLFFSLFTSLRGKLLPKNTKTTMEIT